jgi:hypothetical protein
LTDRLVQVASVNRASLVAVFGFSLIALSTLVVALSAAFLSGYPPRPEPDEGTAAHIFQLSILLLMPSALTFLVTANWARPGRVIRALALPACAVALAFGMLYYFEHVAAAG